MIRISKRPGDYILIGRQGENLARQVVFDIACWEELYGVEGRVELIYQRPRDSAPYPVVIERDGNTVAWTITDTDTATAGNGRAELRYYVGEALVKSATSIITVSAALGVPEEVPDQPGKDWLEQALDAARRAEEAADRAEGVETGGGGTPDAVQFVSQELTEEQQMQARRNLGLYGIRYEFEQVAQWGPDSPGTIGTIETQLDAESYIVEIKDVNPFATRHKGEYKRQGKRGSTASGGLYERFWWGNLALINDADTAGAFDNYTDEYGYGGAPFVIYRYYNEDENADFCRIYIDSSLEPAYWLGFIVNIYASQATAVYEKIPEEYLPESFGEAGNDGGYYTPEVSQPDSNTMRVAYTPSSEDMPAVASQDITLPAGPAGAKGDKGDTGAVGPQGKSAYQQAQEGGYTGTEEAFSAKLAQECYSKSEIDTALGAYITDIDTLVGGES